MWGGAAAAVLLMLVWMASAWVHVRHCRSDGSGIFLQEGVLSFSRGTWSSAQFPQGWRAGVGGFSLRWGFSLPNSGRPWILRFPLCMLVIPFAAAAGVAWHLDTLARRRVRRGLCEQCGYDRTGLPEGAGGSAKCPECGAAGGTGGLDGTA